MRWAHHATRHRRQSRPRRQALAPCLIIWLDQRRTEPHELPSMPLHWDVLFKALGEHDTMRYFAVRPNATGSRQINRKSGQNLQTLLLSGYHPGKLTRTLRRFSRITSGISSHSISKRFDWCKSYDWKGAATDTTPHVARPGTTGWDCSVIYRLKHRVRLVFRKVCH